MNAQEQALLTLATDTMRPCAEELIGQGWRPEVVVFTPDELSRIPGYKVALVVPLSALPQEALQALPARPRLRGLANPAGRERMPVPPGREAGRREGCDPSTADRLDGAT